MRTTNLMAIALCMSLLAAAVRAQSEDATPVLREYFASMQAGDFERSAGFFHPEALSAFRESLSFWKEIPEEAQDGFLDAFFGANATPETVEEKNDAEFFAAFLTAVMKQAGAAGSLNFDGMEILGAVAEEDDVLHYVTRNRVSLGEIEIKSMEVVSVQLTEAGWLLQLSGQMEGVAEQLKAAFAGQMP